MIAANPYTYRGDWYDRDTGFYYLQSRYYDPGTGRFLNADVYVSTGQGIISSNMFVYCENNPVVRSDDGGYFWHFLVGAAVGIATQYVSDVICNILVGKTGTDIFCTIQEPSDLVRYGAAAVSGVLSVTGISLAASVAANTVIGVSSYSLECLIEGKEADASGLILAAGSGLIAGLIGGQGANLKNAEGIVNTGRQMLKTVVSPKKTAMYLDKISNVYIQTAKSLCRTAAGGIFGNIFNSLPEITRNFLK
ncbi:MAG: RHS repeat-associated core domain-containing protein [Clostridia bacterium]|nr:RHS repeat-associated core domain-containing protein [Clostridia bacterium]